MNANVPTPRMTDEELQLRMMQHTASVVRMVQDLFPTPRPCPFCGSAADAGRIGLTSRYGVTCTNDECPVEAQATAGSHAEAVAAWNGVRV